MYLETGAKDVPDKNTEWKVKPLLQPTQYSVIIRGVTLGHCFPSYEAAVEARDAYIKAQNESADCGSNSSTTSTTGSSTYNPKSSSDTQSS